MTPLDSQHRFDVGRRPQFGELGRQDPDRRAPGAARAATSCRFDALRPAFRLAARADTISQRLEQSSTCAACLLEYAPIGKQLRSRQARVGSSRVPAVLVARAMSRVPTSCRQRHPPAIGWSLDRRRREPSPARYARRVLIAIEGVDGAGKRTLTDGLRTAFEAAAEIRRDPGLSPLQALGHGRPRRRGAARRPRRSRRSVYAMAVLFALDRAGARDEIARLHGDQ